MTLSRVNNVGDGVYRICYRDKVLTTIVLNNNILKLEKFTIYIAIVMHI